MLLGMRTTRPSCLGAHRIARLQSTEHGQVCMPSQLITAAGNAYLGAATGLAPVTQPVLQSKGSKGSFDTTIYLTGSCLLVQAACLASPLRPLRTSAAQVQQLTICQARPPRPPKPRESSTSPSPSPSPSPSNSLILNTAEMRPKELNRLLSTAQSAAEVLQLVYIHHGSLDAIHLSTALNTLAKLVQSHDSQLIQQHSGFSLLLSLAEQQAEGFNAHSTANVLWALAKLGQAPSPQLIDKLKAAAQRNLSSSMVKGWPTASGAWPPWATTQAQRCCVLSQSRQQWCSTTLMTR